MKTLLLLLCLSLTSSTCFAQQGTKTPAPVQATAQLFSPKVAPQSDAQPADTRMSEKDYYKMMYEQAKESASGANTISWSALGLVVAVITIILAVQYFFNIRLNTVRLDSIRDNMQTQVADSQTALLSRISDIAAANLQALETRAQAMDLRIQSTVNRELDATKSSLQETIAFQMQNILGDLDSLSKQMSTAPSIVSAFAETEKGNYVYALQHYIKYAESRITPSHIDYWTAHAGIGYIDRVKEYPEQVYDKIAELASILQGARDNAYIFWRGYTKGKRVYKMVNDPQPDDINNLAKIYVEKQPI